MQIATMTQIFLISYAMAYKNSPLHKQDQGLHILKAGNNHLLSYR
ncbi:hypothetical protein [Campylobacter anatolicus]|nr:hypothetical protein [Campylobacter anatolicus]